MSATLTRVLGAATAAYGLAITAKPALLARPCGLVDEKGEVPGPTALLIRAVSARDTAIGAAMAAAGDRGARRLATGSRIVSDLSDAVVFGTMLEESDKRRKVIAFAVTWGALCAAALYASERD
ncbi:hypothetical protein C6N75_23265 [Streptomyces solincola]|uniref:DUF4267 domain-containing protein n=1 Tax=Streptomyces solincola TaxID=2100817 RepID=A0A2S9PR57_9ACTN|nr:hypothetical protein [Streptomyces solincola]PRH76881.1 hypothetical protein C6N75_23265 [Streptomyces solincola]